MTTRQSSRSASIPIPSASRNIESAIQMPFSLSPTRPRVTSASSSRLGTSGDDHRSLGVSYGVRGSSSIAPITTSPTRPTARSMGTAGGFGGRAPSRISVSGSFEPRVIRGDTSRSPDAACHPASTSPARTRRTSGNGRGGGRTPSTQRALHSHSLVPPSPTSNPVFSRPAYLEHSALRHLLQTEAQPSLPLSRKMEATQQESHQGLRRYATASSNADSDDESSVTPPPRDIPPSPSSTVPSQDQMLQLPTRWSEQYRHHLLTVSPDGRDLSYHGASCHGDRDAAAARTNHPIPPACGIYYYEVEIVNKGQQGHISIGFAGRDVKTSRLPGWEPFSWGYHGDDGHSFAAEKSGAGTPYGPTFGTGDVIGCGIDFTTHKAFFTKNSVFIGPVFDNIGKDIEIYPSIGLRHQGESVRVNFGHEPFKFDIDYHVQQQRDAAWGKIMGTSLDTEFLNKTFLGPESKPSESHLTKSLQTDGQTKEAINKLVISYLEHHGYGKTLKAFQKQQSSNAAAAAAVSTSDRDVHMDDGLASEDAPTLAESNMEHRTKIVQAVLSGDIDSAIEDTQRYYPAVLASEEGLMLFKLRCRKFVELLLGAAELKKKMRTRSVSRTRTPTSSVMPVTTHEEAVAEEMDGILEDGVEDVKPPSHVHGAPPGFTVPTSSGMDVDEDGSDAAAVAAAVVPSGSGTPRTPTPASSTNGFNTPTTSAAPRGLSRRRSSNSHPGPVTDFRHGLAAKTATKAQYEAALNEAIIYGQTLSKEYQADSRSEVKQLFKRTAGIVAFDDPMNAAPATGVQEIVGWEAKHGLAMELNRAILRSLGQPTTPKLETVYRHTAVCISQLGLMGVGSAAFADMGKELLEA